MSAPKPVGPYTPIVRAGDWLIVSGQVGVEGGKLPDGVAAQTAQAVRNVAAQLATEGAALTDVAKTLCFLTDMGDFAAVNEVYGEYLGESPPARVAYGVAALPKGAQVEIDAIIALPD